jgi:hypothetical protein
VDLGGEALDVAHDCRLVRLEGGHVGRGRLARGLQRLEVAGGVAFDALEQRLGASPGVRDGTLGLRRLGCAQQLVELRERRQQVRQVGVAEAADLLVGQRLGCQEAFEGEGERGGPVQHGRRAEAGDGRVAGGAIERALQVAPGHELAEVVLAALGGPARLERAQGGQDVLDAELGGVLGALARLEDTQQRAVVLGALGHQIPRFGQRAQRRGGATGEHLF